MKGFSEQWVITCNGEFLISDNPNYSKDHKLALNFRNHEEAEFYLLEFMKRGHGGYFQIEKLYFLNPMELFV